MLYRETVLKKQKYFLKSIHGLWIIPVLIINLIVPLINFLLYKINRNDMEIDMEKMMFFFLPLFSVWTVVFISEIFFSEKTKDVFFFYSNKKKFIASLFYFLPFLADALAVVLLHFYCIDDYMGLSFKILSVAVFYYGASLLILRCSKSAAITILIIRHGLSITMNFK